MTKNTAVGVISLLLVVLMTTVGMILIRPSFGAAVVLLAAVVLSAVPPMLAIFVQATPSALRSRDRRDRYGWWALHALPFLGAGAIITTSVIQGLSAAGATLLVLAGGLALAICLIRIGRSLSDDSSGHPQDR